MQCFELSRGDSPLLVSIPHAGTALPADLVPRLTSRARQLEDTDWRVDELYAFLGDMDVTLLVANYSRYVVDLNRQPDAESLYPGQSVSALCPLQSFAGDRLYRTGAEPAESEVNQRVQDYWQPYHRALAAELERIRSRHGHAVLWDAHSICAEVPRLFSGSLPDLNFGTADGRACDQTLLESLETLAAAAPNFSWVSNGRFKGGAITRMYGCPRAGIHAVQLELSQATYLRRAAPQIETRGGGEDPALVFPLCEQRSGVLRPLLRALLQATLNWEPTDTGAAACSQ